jgi:hypothetical protein
VVCASLKEAGFAPASLPAVGLFDVVEHIEDDHGFLEMIRNYLSPQGRVYITVPAYPALWSHEDIDAGHYRRYRKPDLRELLQKAGFAVEFVTGFFQFLPPAILAARVLPYRLGIAKAAGAHVANGKMKEQHEVHSPLIGKILELMQQREIAQIRSRQETNFGGSWLAVGKAIG